MNRFWIAMTLYALIAVLAWQTLTATIDAYGQKVRLVWVVWAILAMLALRTWLWQRLQETGASHDRK